MILGYLIECSGGCGLRMLVSRNISHRCEACLERTSDGQDFLPLGEVTG